MSKLSPEQKAANKVASQVHSKAFRARRKAYDAAMAAALATAEQLPEHTERVTASEEFERALVQRDSAVQAIDQEIARLQAKREEVRKQHGLAIDAAKARADLSFNAHAAAQQSLVDAVKADYPDMAGVYLASHWRRPEGV